VAKVRFVFGVAAILLFVSTSPAQTSQPDGGGIRKGSLPLIWSTGGPKCMEMPEWQVHEYNPDLFILRQSGCTDFEKPFLYLLFGKERALLLDTGSRNGNLTPALQHTIRQWLLRNNRTSISLIVAHSHSHTDHTAGDAELKALKEPAISIDFVPATVDATKKFYGITNWPEDHGSVDLGDRIIDVIAIPGHDAVSVALYDRQTAILFTGDSLYPGRIYIRDFPAFVASNTRLVNFTDGKLVAHILGCHIEETRTPYLDYPVGTIYQPDEHELALSRGALLEMQSALEKLNGTPKRVALRDLSLWPTGPAFRSNDESQLKFTETQEYQRKHMWDQTQP
jgi:hydroxyacylglutathione hydrolase